MYFTLIFSSANKCEFLESQCNALQHKCDDLEEALHKMKCRLDISSSNKLHKSTETDVTAIDMIEYSNNVKFNLDLTNKNLHDFAQLELVLYILYTNITNIIYINFILLYKYILSSFL